MGRIEEQRFYRIRQTLKSPEVGDLDAAVSLALASMDMAKEFSGQKVGITAGSRGICRIPEILRALAGEIRAAGGEPELVPAMGSHGFGSGKMQRDILAGLGISEKSVGCPITAEDEVVRLGSLPDGSPVYCHKRATEVGRLMVVNRIKTHTDFEGEIESGLCKMLSIGLGGHPGAEAVHQKAVRVGHPAAILDTAGYLLQRLPVIGGLGILENWQGRTMRLEAIPAANIVEAEKELLAWLKERMLKLPFAELDVLLLGEIGKNIAGTGMDTKVVGRIGVLGQKEPQKPKIRCLAVLGLTAESHGNACGIGLADLTTQSVVDGIDLLATGDNALTSQAPRQGKIPCVCAHDRAALRAAQGLAGPLNSGDLRVVYVQNTARLETMAISEALLDEVRGDPRLTILGGPELLRFDESGRLQNFRSGV